MKRSDLTVSIVKCIVYTFFVLLFLLGWGCGKLVALLPSKPFKLFKNETIMVAKFFRKILNYVITPITVPNLGGKNLSYVITPVTVAKFWGKNMSYVITPVTVAKFWAKNLSYVITPV